MTLVAINGLDAAWFERNDRSDMTLGAENGSKFLVHAYPFQLRDYSAVGAASRRIEKILEAPKCLFSGREDKS
jgi:hypothetical protein